VRLGVTFTSDAGLIDLDNELARVREFQITLQV